MLVEVGVNERTGKKGKDNKGDKDFQD